MLLLHMPVLSPPYVLCPTRVHAPPVAMYAHHCSRLSHHSHHPTLIFLCTIVTVMVNVVGVVAWMTDMVVVDTPCPVLHRSKSSLVLGSQLEKTRKVPGNAKKSANVTESAV